MSNLTIRRVKEGTQDQGTKERVAYTITTTPWGSSPTGVVVTVYDKQPGDTLSDVTDTVTSGAASVTGDVITLPYILGLTNTHSYRVEVVFVSSGGSTLECYFEINCTH